MSRGCATARIVLCLLLWLGWLALGWAAELPPELQHLSSFLSESGEQPDLLGAKLLIDQAIDPAIDVEDVTRRVEELASRIRRRIPASASNRVPLDLLLSSLYEPGPWNDHRPFSYDLQDPLGHDARSSLLSVYLDRRKGNCVSMPILFAIIGQKLGLPVTLATAPRHLLVKYLDDDGQWLNVEATSGGFKHDSSYTRELGISPHATESRIYLRPLNRRETVGRMLGTLMNHYDRTGRGAELIATADLALSFDPRDVGAMIHAASGYYLLLETVRQRYPDPADIPPEEQDGVRLMLDANLGLIARAKALGWMPPTPEQEAAYLQSIEREKTKRGIDE